MLALLAQAAITMAAWGGTGEVPLYTISDGHSAVDVTPQGARVVAWRVADRTGHLDNVLVGPASPQALTGLMNVAGATIGRYANRIAGGHLTIDGDTYALSINNRGNTLHGGEKGFHTQFWHTEKLRDGVRFTRLSPEGEMGFPGALTVSVTYRLIHTHAGEELSIAYRATTTRATVVNLTNHAFFNLSGGNSITGTAAWIAADTYAPTNASGIPTGQIAPVTGQPWDFTQARNFDAAKGIDAALVLNPRRQTPAAIFTDTASGRRMSVFTSEPAAQLFTAPTTGPGGAFCFETQHLPDAPNQSAFAPTLLRPGQVFHAQTRYVIGLAP